MLARPLLQPRARRRCQYLRCRAQPGRRPRTTEPLRFTAVCWWCGGTYPTTTRWSRYCNDTHSGAAAKARRKRRVRAGQARLRAGAPPCPRPDKYAYPSIDVAVAVARGMRENGLLDDHPLRAYWCVCGQTHVGRLDEDLERRLSAPLDPVLRRERGLDPPSD
ncbi:hypothetical protein [Kineococcus rhizosphaerae]|uniref:hypothetical protein n=1 Tax=Kineococcus rhizosphaerae TaxID=559628 RepID=UPI000D05D882|nr:hypothetical protein [Kineococcus rhizosphaerae]